MAEFLKYISKIWKTLTGDFVASLRQVTSNPSADWRMTVVVGGITLLTLILIIVIVVPIIASARKRWTKKVVFIEDIEDELSPKSEEAATKHEQQSDEKPSFKRVKPHMFFLSWGFIILFILIFFIGSDSYVSRPSFCPKCHLMQTAYKGWKTSSHRKVDCSGCHQTPGLTGISMRRLNYLREAIVSSTKKTDKPSSEISNRSCLRCHDAISKDTVVQYNVRVSHKEFLGDSCSSCHGNVGHGKESRLKTEPSMNKCLVCHDDSKAPARCNLCHVKDIGEKMRKPKRDKLKTMVTALTNCRGCHPTNRCTEHHGTEMPHQMPEWKKTHGKSIENTNNPICWRCHPDDYSSCQRCHTSTAPHSDKWQELHAYVVLGQRPYGLKECKRCHAPDSCQSCHEPGGDGFGPAIKNLDKLLKWEWKPEPVR